MGDEPYQNIKSTQRFKNTPYMLKEILTAREQFKEIFSRFPSRALLSLQRKCQLAAHGPRHPTQTKTFSNIYFTDVNLQPPFPEIPERELEGIRDVSDDSVVAGTSAQCDIQSGGSGSSQVIHISSGEDDDVIVIKEIYPDGEQQNNTGSTQSSGRQIPSTRKRKLEGGRHENTCCGDVFTGPITDMDNPSVKRPRHGSGLQSTDVSNTKLIWQCDLCDMKFTSTDGMNEHLQVKEHYSGSVVLCEQQGGELLPKLILSPAIIKHLPALGKLVLPVCPDGDCKALFADIYSCSQHNYVTHEFPTQTRYGLRKVKCEDIIHIPTRQRCSCGKQCRNSRQLQNHVLKCDSCFKSKPNRSTFLIFICPICNELFHMFVTAKKHVVRCSRKWKKEKNVRAVQLELLSECRDHLPLKTAETS